MFRNRLYKNSYFLTISTALSVVAGTVLILMAADAASALLFMLMAVISLCGIVLCNHFKKWAETISVKIQNLAREQERLACDIARNRNGISDLKSSLSMAAFAIKSKIKDDDNEAVHERQTLETIATEITKLEKSRQRQNRQTYERQIMKLTSTPAPETRPPKSGTAGTTFSETDDFSDTVILELLHHALKHDQMDLFAQPVVSLPGRKVRYYELFGRIRARAGAYVPANRYMRMAHQDNLVTTIDKIILLKCLQHLRDSKAEEVETGYFLNIGPGTLKSSSIIVSLLAFVAHHRPLAKRLVFEMGEEDFRKLDDSMKAVLKGLSKLDCRFSMDHLKGQEIDPEELRKNNISFLKVDAGWLVNEAGSEEGLQHIRRLKKELENAGIEIIAEKIESNKDLRELLDHELDYGQGYHLGKPDYFSAYTRRKLNDNKTRKEKETYILSPGRKRNSA